MSIQINPYMGTQDIFGVKVVRSTLTPTVSNSGYPEGTIWVNTTSDNVYVLADNTSGAAVWKEIGSSSGEDWQPSVLSMADCTAAPPSESTGDRYILDETGGAVHADWDGAAKKSIVQFDGTSWIETVPTEGMATEVEDEDTVYLYLTAWVKFFDVVGATFATDSGNAAPSSGTITFTGGEAIDTSGAGAAVTIACEDASETNKGVAELATTAEVVAGTDTTRIVTTAGVTAKLGTQTDHGVLVGSGTAAAVTALSVGTNGQLLVGSTGADPVFATVTDGEAITTTLGAGTFQIDCEDASETNKGVAELATTAEVVAGTDTTRIVTTAGVTAKLGTQTDHGVLVGSGTAAAVTALAVGTNGQVIVGSTGADPVFATITDGEAITTTLGAGTLQIDCEDASDINKGVIEIATDAEAVAVTATDKAIVPSNLGGVFAAPPAIGGTTPAAGAFTTVTTTSTLGVNEASPVTAVEITGTSPYLTLHNSTDEDASGGRKSRIIGRGEQSGGEESILGWIEFSHEGLGDDQKGKLSININDGNDGTSPGNKLIMGSDGSSTFYSTGAATLFAERTNEGQQQIRQKNTEGEGFGFVVDNYAWYLYDFEDSAYRIFVDTDGKVGFNEANPTSYFEMTVPEPHITLHNTTHEDTDGGRESRLIARGEQSGGEETILGYLEFSHDGTSDDQKGKFLINLNDGNDGTSPTNVLEVDSSGNLTVTGSISGDFTLDATPDSDLDVSGTIIQLVANENQAFGDACRIDSDGEAHIADASVIATSSAVVICADATISAAATGNYLISGVARKDSWAWTVGGLIYLTVTGTTTNTLSQTPPSASNEVVQVLGVATHADRILWTPSLVQIELV